MSFLTLVNKGKNIKIILESLQNWNSLRLSRSIGSSIRLVQKENILFQVNKVLFEAIFLCAFAKLSTWTIFGTYSF